MDSDCRHLGSVPHFQPGGADMGSHFQAFTWPEPMQQDKNTFGLRAKDIIASFPFDDCSTGSKVIAGALSPHSVLALVGFMSTNAWDDDDIPRDHELSPVPQAVKPSTEKVRDEWDEDDEGDEETAESANIAQPDVESPSRVPSEQSSASTTTKPQIVSSYNAGSAGSSFPPELSFEPPVRILKRPKPAGPSSSSSSTGNNDRKTLQEREEKYRLARERIFGSSPSSSPSTPSTPNRTSSPTELGRAGEQPPIARDAQVQRKEQPMPFSRPVREPLGPGTHPAFSRGPLPEHDASLSSSSAT